MSTLNISCLCINLIDQEFGIHILKLSSAEKISLKSYKLPSGDNMLNHESPPSNAAEEVYITEIVTGSVEHNKCFAIFKGLATDGTF